MCFNAVYCAYIYIYIYMLSAVCVNASSWLTFGGSRGEKYTHIFPFFLLFSTEVKMYV